MEAKQTAEVKRNKHESESDAYEPEIDVRKPDKAAEMMTEVLKQSKEINCMSHRSTLIYRLLYQK